MRFLLDQNMPALLADWLKSRGHEADHVRLLGMMEADDAVIAAWARSVGACVITKDADFQWLAAPPPTGPQIVWIRFGNTTNPELMTKWDAFWPSIEAALHAGDALVEVL